MNSMKTKLEISEIEKALGKSYPTVLKLAKEQGELIDEGPRGKWLIPINVVLDEINEQIARGKYCEQLISNGS